jgi:chromosome segregation ATPase
MPNSQRQEDCCNGEMQSRVRALEVYRETHQEKLERLTDAIEKNNEHLATLNTRLVEVRTTQRNTHAFAGFLGTAVGFLGEHFMTWIFPSK